MVHNIEHAIDKHSLLPALIHSTAPILVDYFSTNVSLFMKLKGTVVPIEIA